MAGYIDNILNSADGKKISKLSQKSGTYNLGYYYWRNVLFERAMRLFVWDGTGEVPAKEIESRLLLQGFVGITDKYKNTLTAFFGSMTGPTVYQDEFTTYNAFSPVWSGSLTIGKDVEIINNNALRNSLYPLVHRYAMMLAHAETTLINVLVNARDSGGVPVAQTQNQIESIKEYQANIYNGVYGQIKDPAFLGVEYKGIRRGTEQNIKDVYEIRMDLLHSFYEDLGVKTSHDKKGNMIVEEVESNNSLLLLNLSDMLYYRQLGCDVINKHYGTNWSVRIAKELDYAVNGGTSNERND